MDLRAELEQRAFEPVDFETEWGNKKIENGLEMIQYCHDQLAFYLKNNRSPNPEHTRRQLFGYAEILGTKSERIARFYLCAAGKFRDKGIKKSTVEVIDYLKLNHYWETEG